MPQPPGQAPDWIVVKSICDFADGLKKVGEPSAQTRAASASAEFVLRTIARGGFARI